MKLYEVKALAHETQSHNDAKRVAGCRTDYFDK